MGNQQGEAARGALALRDVLPLVKGTVTLVIRDQRTEQSSDATRMSALSGDTLADQLRASRVLAGNALLDCSPGSVRDENGTIVITVWPFDGPREERRD